MTGKSAHGCFVGMKQSKCFHYAHLCSVSRQQITKPVQLHCPAHELAAIPFTIIDGFVAVVLHGSSSFVVCIADRPLLRGLRLTGTILSNYTVVRNTILHSLCGSMRSFRGTPKLSQRRSPRYGILCCQVPAHHVANGPDLRFIETSTPQIFIGDWRLCRPPSVTRRAWAIPGCIRLGLTSYMLSIAKGRLCGC
jgi:hypothetical protein